jgi:hypothetical protein
MRDGDQATRTRRVRRWLLAVLLVLAAFVVFVLFWFQPQKLLIDERVEEPIPTAAPSPVTTATPEPVPSTTASGDGGATTAAGPATTATTAPPATLPPPAGPVELVRGDFISRDHGTSGVARVLELADGQRIVRLEGLDTDNGPDLYLYLTASPAAGDEAAFDDDHVNLGRLKGNQGDQNYELPAGTDLTRHATVVIWCDRFNSAFGAADLQPPA